MVSVVLGSGEGGRWKERGGARGRGKIKTKHREKMLVLGLKVSFA